MDQAHRQPLADRGTRGCGQALPEAGFTLVEVLVALAVMATMMTALALASSSRVDSVSYMRDRTIATWIASDRLTELRLAPQWPDTGTHDGEVKAAGRTWQWQAEISNTPDQHVRRVEVIVRLGESGNRLSRLVGFVSDPGIRAGPGEPS